MTSFTSAAFDECQRLRRYLKVDSRGNECQNEVKCRRRWNRKEKTSESQRGQDNSLRGPTLEFLDTP